MKYTSTFSLLSTLSKFNPNGINSYTNSSTMKQVYLSSKFLNFTLSTIVCLFSLISMSNLNAQNAPLGCDKYTMLVGDLLDAGGSTTEVFQFSFNGATSSCKLDGNTGGEGMVIDPTKNLAYIASPSGAGIIKIYDFATASYLPPIQFPAGEDLLDVSMSTDFQNLFVATYTGVYKVSTTTNTITAYYPETNISTAKNLNIWGVAVQPSTGRVFLSTDWVVAPSSIVSIASSLTGAPTVIVPESALVGWKVRGLNFDASGNLWAVMTNDVTSRIVKYSPTGTVLNTYNFATNVDPYDLAFGPDGNLYVTTFYGACVIKLNVSTGALSDYLPPQVGTRGKAIAFVCGNFKCPCVFPIVSTSNISKTSAACSGSTALNNASVTINNIQYANAADIKEGSTYGQTPLYGAGTNRTNFGTTLTFNNLKPSTTYTVRFFNGSDNCFTDITFNTNAINCVPCQGCTSSPNLLPMGNFEQNTSNGLNGNSNIATSTLKLGNNASRTVLLTENTANADDVTGWYAGPSFYYVKKDGATNNPEGEHFIWLPNKDKCLVLNNGIVNSLDLCPGKQYTICLRAAAWKQDLINGVPGAIPTQVPAKFAIEFFTRNNTNATVGDVSFDLPASTSWDNLNWQTINHTFTYDSNDPISHIIFSNWGNNNSDSNVGITLDDVKIYEATCNQVCFGTPVGCSDIKAPSGLCYGGSTAPILLDVAPNGTGNYILKSGTTPKFTRYNNGTARLQMVVVRQSNTAYEYDVDITMTGETTTGTPKVDPDCPSYPAANAILKYYATVTGSMTGLNAAAGTHVNITLGSFPKFQVGIGASTNSAADGAAGWLQANSNNGNFGTGQIDIEFDFNCCSINGVAATPTCVSGGNTVATADDSWKFSLTVNKTGSSPGSTWKILNPLGAVIKTGTYGVATDVFVSGYFGGGQNTQATFVVKDEVDGGCQYNLVINQPKCSPDPCPAFSATLPNGTNALYDVNYNCTITQLLVCFKVRGTNGRPWTVSIKRTNDPADHGYVIKSGTGDQTVQICGNPIRGADLTQIKTYDPNNLTVWMMLDGIDDCVTDVTIPYVCPYCDLKTIPTANTPCQGSSLDLKANATINSGATIISYAWSGTNAYTASIANPIIANAQPNQSGSYTVTITDSNGCKATGTVNATVKPNPVATINTNPASTNPVCANTAIAFTATDAGIGATYAWEFGAGASVATAFGVGPHNVTYNTCASRDVKLTVTLNACISITTKTVNTTEATPPVLVGVPPNTLAECSNIPAVPTNITATDNCPNPTVTYVGETSTKGTDVNACTNNQYLLTRTWKATDFCGNTATKSYTIDIKDTTKPVFANVPTDKTVECSNITPSIPPTATDLCDNSVTIVTKPDVRVNGDCDDRYTIKREWTATDNCSNVTTATQLVTVQDTQAPTFTTVPPAATVNCENPPTPGTPTATDLCDAQVAIALTNTVSTKTNLTGNCTDNSYTVTYTWTATDNCGNTKTASQIVTVQDVTKPVLVNCPVNINVTTAQVVPSVPPTATDNCDNAVSIVPTEVSNPLGCQYTITRTWTASDNCNNTSVCTQVITVNANLTCTAAVTSKYFPAGANYVATDKGNDISTYNGTDGKASVTGTGGTLPYTYKWSNSQTTQEATGLVAGTYTVTVTDKFGCTTSCTVTLKAPAKLGDKIFEDKNGNGVQDSGEPGIAGVTVIITGTDENGKSVTITLVTDANGMYMIDGLVPGTYKITVTKPAGQEFTYPNQIGGANGGTEATDSDIDPATGMSNTVILTNGQNYPDLDGGLYRPASLGDFVWDDKNANGVQDPLEPGISGVLVTLTGTTGNGTAVTLTATTDANGKYLFPNLRPGSYKVTFGTPATYKPTYKDLGGNDATDSDADPATGMTGNYPLISGDNNLTVDAGFYKPASLGDFVWNDTDGDGVQDAGEPGIPGVLVTLTGVTGNNTPVTLTATTDANGKYTFNDLIPGTYKVTFTKPAGFGASPKDLGGNDTADSDADPVSGMTGNYTLVSGENNPTVDAGFYGLASIGNYVWEDKNANGVQDGGETPIAGVLVTLTGTTGSGTPITLTKTTDANGLYLFDNLQPGTYKLTFATPTGGFKPTYANQGTNDGVDSDASVTTGETVDEILTSGENNLTYDAGFYKPASLGDFVFEDKNGNGIQDAGELGIAGVLVTLTGTTGNGTLVTLTATTDANGKYIFTDLVPGTYKVTFGTPAGGFKPTYVNQGTDDAIDSDADPLNALMSVNEVLESGENNLTYDAGFYKPASLGDFVFEDKNGNGIQDAGEPGIAGVTVTLTGTTGNGTPVTLTATTDANGKYVFTDLVPGTYKVTFGKPATFTASPINEGTDDTKDSDADPASGMTGNYTLVSGENNTTVDAGFYKPASLGDFVWEDKNGNGVQDAGEPGIAGVTVTLTGTTGNGTPVTLTATTDANGKYLFPNLQPGTYKVTFGTPTGGFVPTYVNQGANDATDSDADPLNALMSVNEVLESGENNLTYDAGFYKPASLGDYVWEDKNANGVQDAGETPIQGVLVTLTGTTGNGTAVTLTATTDASGKYLFPNLVPGTYKVTFGTPTGFTATDVNQGTDDTKDSDADKATGMTGDYTLVSGENNLTVDAGFFKPAKLGDFVFLDKNANGIQDAGEPGIAGVTVMLLDSNNQPAKDADGNLVPAATTDANGMYMFANLKPGVSYVVMFTKPTGFVTTEPDKDGDDTKDSDISTSTNKSPIVILSSGEYNQTIDAGYFENASIGNYAWVDCNQNGIQDESGANALPGVPVTLTGTDGFGNPVGPVTKNTDAAGNYNFINLVPGTYTIKFGYPTTPLQIALTTKGTGGNDVLDSDADPVTGVANARTLISGQIQNNVDAGFKDVGKPVLAGTPPPNITVECSAIPTATIIGVGGVTATDNYDTNVIITFVENNPKPTDPAACDAWVITRTWTATDDCLNSTSFVQTITVQDKTPPVLVNVPVDVTVECDDVPSMGAPAATDNCDTKIIITPKETRVNNTNPACIDTYTLKREWTATDNCGNTDVKTQIITVQDIKAPVIDLASVPKNVTINCDDAIPAVVLPTATDNCDKAVTVTSNDVSTKSTDTNTCLSNSYTITRTFTATDNCNNSTTASQVINVKDDSKPTFDLATVPANTTINCDDAVPAAVNPKATDKCDPNVTVTMVEVSTKSTDATACLSNTYVITRTWTATDNCLNSTTVSQTINVKDDTKPTFDLATVPANTTINCDDAVPAAVNPKATDKCDPNVAVTMVEVSTKSTDATDCLSNTYVITRTWTATDNCLNSTTVSQTINVKDDTKPTFDLATVPANTTINCDDAVPAAVNPKATDKCDADVTVTMVETSTKSTDATLCLSNTYVITRTWTATDNCLNSTTVSQTINVKDDTKPTFDLATVPANTTINCDDAVPAAVNPKATDKCDADVTVTMVEVSTKSTDATACLSNTYVITRTWTATDNCLNSTTVSQTLVLYRLLRLLFVKQLCCLNSYLSLSMYE